MRRRFLVVISGIALLFILFGFQFNPHVWITPDDTQTGLPGELDSVSYLMAFDADTSNLAAGYGIRFDLYHKDLSGAVDDKAPFSHDAESTSNPVPEPATLLLLRSGLVGLAGFGRRKLRKGYAFPDPGSSTRRRQDGTNAETLLTHPAFIRTCLSLPFGLP